MLEGLLQLFARRPILQVAVDILDLLIVTFLVYRALLVLRGTRAMQMGLGLGLIVLVYFASGRAGFVTLYKMLDELLSSVILIIVVVFQNDIRRGLMRVGARAFFSGITREQESRVIDEVVAAATELARHRTGALICFEQDANLDEFVVGQGTVLDAAVQRELLVGLFVPEAMNKLHDGAVIIRNLRIAKAGVFFPMPDTKVLDKSLGSRHRAALGITEETDAVVVVVSEERGTISFCFNGNIVSNLDGASLRQALLGLFGKSARKKKGGAPVSRRPSLAGARISTVPGTGPVTSAMATGNTGSVILPPVSNREGTRGDTPRPDPQRIDTPKARPIAAARIETPKPMPATELPPPRDPPENT
jgi:diadenylate cyclase